MEGESIEVAEGSGMMERVNTFISDILKAPYEHYICCGHFVVKCNNIHMQLTILCIQSVESEKPVGIMLEVASKMRIQDVSINPLNHLAYTMGYLEMTLQFTENPSGFGVPQFSVLPQNHYSDKSGASPLDDNCGQRKPKVPNEKDFLNNAAEVSGGEESKGRRKKCATPSKYRVHGMQISALLNIIVIAVLACKYLQNGGQSSVTEISNLKSDHEKINYIGSTNDGRGQISAHSYNEYQTRVHHILPAVELDVILYAGLTGSWPNNVPLQSAGQIKNLSLHGHFSKQSILSILEQTKYIQHLTFVGSEAGFDYTCQNITHEATGIDLLHLPLHLQSLANVRLENFTNISGIIRIITTDVLAPQLNMFGLVKSEIDENGLRDVEGFIISNKYSLRHLYFPDTKWQSALFDSSLHTFLGIKTFEIDFLPYRLMNHDYIGSNFCQVFPNLSSFKSNKGYLSWNGIERILECTSLRDLKAGIHVPKEMDSVNMMFLRNSYPSLRVVDIALFFPDKSIMDVCHIEGLHAEKRRFDRLTVGANCQIEI